MQKHVTGFGAILKLVHDAETRDRFWRQFKTCDTILILKVLFPIDFCLIGLC
jgi:hypothetical protein